MMRKAISKSTRFRIFARDRFTCRYCGRQSDVVPLEVDHLIPVAQGGTNDDGNLITSCFDCNRGKGAKTLAQSAPTETDRLRLAQERNEQIVTAKAVADAAKARTQLFDQVVDYWCSVTGSDTYDAPTLKTIARYVHEFGPELVFRWIDNAYIRCRNDRRMGQYISGCRRSHLKEQGLAP